MSTSIDSVGAVTRRAFNNRGVLQYRCRVLISSQAKRKLLGLCSTAGHRNVRPERSLIIWRIARPFVAPSSRHCQSGLQDVKNWRRRRKLPAQCVPSRGGGRTWLLRARFYRLWWFLDRHREFEESEKMVSPQRRRALKSSDLNCVL